MYIETGIQLYMYMLLRYKLGYGLQKELAFGLHDSSILPKKPINLTKLHVTHGRALHDSGLSSPHTFDGYLAHLQDILHNEAKPTVFLMVEE